MQGRKMLEKVCVCLKRRGWESVTEIIWDFHENMATPLSSSARSPSFAHVTTTVSVYK